MPWKRKWQPTPVFLPGESHGQRSLAGYRVHRVAKSQTRWATHPFTFINKSVTWEVMEDKNLKSKFGRFCDSMDCSPPGSSVHGILQARIVEWVAVPFSRGSFQARDWTQAFCSTGTFFTNWATREAQEYWTVSLSLLQGIFLIQQLNRDLLHCRRILYCLSHQGSPSLILTLVPYCLIV